MHRTMLFHWGYIHLIKSILSFPMHNCLWPTCIVYLRFNFGLAKPPLKWGNWWVLLLTALCGCDNSILFMAFYDTPVANCTLYMKVIVDAVLTQFVHKLSIWSSDWTEFQDMPYIGNLLTYPFNFIMVQIISVWLPSMYQVGTFSSDFNDQFG